MNSRFERKRGSDAGSHVYFIKDKKSGVSFTYGGKREGDGVVRWRATVRVFPNISTTRVFTSRVEVRAWMRRVLNAYEAMSRHETGANVRFNKEVL